MPTRQTIWVWIAGVVLLPLLAGGQEEKMTTTNRLAQTQSPYLLQHAYNPVDWYPWGEEAFAKARSENKPIFLSIGYSTCHWCHVMERESFENQEIAAVINEHFVAVKVDREERPDVDAVYMSYVQAATGHGGWPMSVWLTPDLKPFMGGTYFPPARFKVLLERIAGGWETEREVILRSGDSVVEQLREFAQVQSDDGTGLDGALSEKAFDQLQRSYDSGLGGFGGAPKFPRPSTLNFLFRYHARTGNKAARDMTLHTLRAMARGGINDHLGGGFHRYSTDARWHLPHFEKMLYDQGQLVCAYLEAFQLTRDEMFAEVARDTLDYVLRDLTGPEGQFYSAEDADSPVPGKAEEKAEGAFYVWEEGELEALLGDRLAALVVFHYGVRKQGNVEQDPHGEFPQKNVLAVAHTLDETAQKFDQSEIDIAAQLKAARGKLFAAREKRPRPHLDDKTLTSWNGLMISAFARAHQVLDEPRYLAAAERAARFLKQHLYKEQRLLRRYRAGHAEIPGFADDYAFLVQGLLDLYEASFGWEWLEWARNLQTAQDELFWDQTDGGYFKTTGSDKNILLRMKEGYDGAEPAPSSVAALNLLRLAQMTDHDPWKRRGERTLQTFANRMERIPVGMPQMLAALEFHLSTPRQIIVVGRKGSADLSELVRVVHREYLPSKILLWVDATRSDTHLAKVVEPAGDMVMVDEKATAYVCQNYRCELPLTDPKKLAALLAEDQKP